ncbi:hypothetical protein LSH36_561g03004 [Paralvinella palmiformis]|uniref:Uncharacterized protein n=1 Tax=Paralvinella palmiformis TaxID=53620 RepID=A0AAD9J606_9ANNE|nr:hypothetical protein LSH36_561g03004 [Paralvinella palmiformis]
MMKYPNAIATNFLQLNQNKVPFDQTLPLEDDEEDEDDSMPSNDVVFFPPKEEEEGSDTTAKSYRVFEGDVASVAESDGTEQSVDSDEEETCKTADSSMPSTPDMDHFILNQISLEDGTEEKFDQVIPDVPQPPNESTTRLSMSTRFLSLSQQPNLRHSNKSQPPTLQDRKQMMAQAVMETRKRLQADGRSERRAVIPQRRLYPNEITALRPLVPRISRLPYELLFCAGREPSSLTKETLDELRNNHIGFTDASLLERSS